MKRIVLSILLLSMPVFAQPSGAPSFEVASVKLHTFPPDAFGFGPGAGGDGANIRISGNRVTIGQSTFTRLVMAAYQVKDFQIDGIPATLGRDQFYDIAAKVEGENSPAPEQVRLMLQSLLAERFRLQLHRETKALSVYDLVVAKKGPRLTESTGPRPAQPITYNGRVMQLTLLDRSVADLVAFVAPDVDRPVLDKTSLSGRYDFSLEYSRSNPDLPASDPDRPVFAAIQDLGLRLAPAKEQAEVLVVGHAERPSAN